jgi:hypothetical protein
LLIRIALLCVALSIVGFDSLASPPQAGPSRSVRVSIEEPRNGDIVRNLVHQAPIRGSAIADPDMLPKIDIIIVIDISGSTAHPSGVDVDADGHLGFDPSEELVPAGQYPLGTVCTDPEDTILAAEVAAAAALIENLDSSSMRVGVVSFSSDPRTIQGNKVPGQQDAWVETPLTRDFQRAYRALEDMLLRGPNGGTNFAAGIRLAVTELAGLSGARSAARANSRKIVMFLSDGVPSLPVLPFSEHDPGDVDAAIYAAQLARKAGVVINSYALGRGALSDPLAATEISRITHGTYTPVRNPGDVITYLEGVSFTSVKDVTLINLTTSEIAEEVHLFPDGTFSAFLPVREGTNRVRVTALASDGSKDSVETEFEFEIMGLTKGELVIELERIRKQNRELELSVERERLRRAIEEQRRTLEIEVEE